MEGRGRGRGRGGPGGGRGRGRGRPGADAHRALEGAAPHIVQVVEFARARTQELEALTRAISTTSGSKRAFQTLPRHLRRRAMSHNIKRLPVRLRMQAQNEMDVAPPKGSTTLKRHRKNKRRPGYLLRDYERRQKKNVWLETHIWHAKRFKMVNLWGYKIALHPSDRSVRACYRASAHVCTTHDASYQTCIELSGKEKNILDLLRSMTDPTGPFVVSSRPYLHGKRSGNMMLHHPATFPMGAIAPVSFLWRPLPNPSSDHTDVRRQLWVWVHPSASAELLQAFHKVASQHEVIWTSLKDELVRFELTGPHSHTILTSTLRLAPGGASSESELGTDSKATSIWNALNQLRIPASLPSGAVLAISVEDPREQALTQTLVNEWPSEAVESSLWDKDARDALAKGFYSDAEMVKRKKAQPLFSASNTSDVSMAIDPVEAQQQQQQQQETSFAKVPVLLVQRPHKLERGYGAGWDVILPSRWGMTFWKSFIYAGARSIGLREHRKQASEQGLPHFPEDYPDTNAYHDYIQSHAQDLMETYFKKPPAKRPNYDKLAVDSPFFPDFYSLLSLALPDELLGDDDDDDDDEDSEEEAEAVDGEEEKEQATTGHNAEDKGKDKMDEDHEGEEDPRPSSSGEEVVMTEFIPRPLFVTRTHHGVPTTASLPSLACVSLRMVDRGVPHYNALVCLPTEHDLALYQARCLHRRGSHRFARKATVRPARQEPGDPDDEEEALDNDDEKGPLASLHQHGEREVIGFVTAGDYSYIRGSGSALGFCASAALSAHWPPVLLVRNTSSPFYFPATYSLLSSTSTSS